MCSHVVAVLLAGTPPGVPIRSGPGPGGRMKRPLVTVGKDTWVYAPVVWGVTGDTNASNASARCPYVALAPGRPWCAGAARDRRGRRPDILAIFRCLPGDDTSAVPTNSGGRPVPVRHLRQGLGRRRAAYGRRGAGNGRRRPALEAAARASRTAAAMDALLRCRTRLRARVGQWWDRQARAALPDFRRWRPLGSGRPARPIDDLLHRHSGLVCGRSEHGWYLVPAYSYQESQDFTLYTTGNGGATWTPLLTADIGHPQSHGMSYAGAKTGLWFRDARTGWVGQTGQGQASLWFSSDGGSDWQEEKLPAPPAGWDPSARVVAGVPAVFPDDTGAVVVATVSPPSAGAPTVSAYTYTTTDGGRTWADPRPLPQAASAGASVLVPSSVAIRSGRQWWYGGGPVLYLTEDAGNHWRELGSAPRGFIFTSIQGVDGSHGWAVATRFTGCSQAGPCRSATSELVRIDEGGGRLSV